MKTARSKKTLAVVTPADAVHVERWQWRQLIASEYGPASATTRHVLHVLSMHMNPAGAGCWPAQTTIAKRTGLTSRAVKMHIAIAKRVFWLTVTEHHYTGQGWRRNSYVATVPAALFPLIHRGGEPDAPALERGEPYSPTWGTSFPEVGNDVPPNLRVLNSSLNMSERRPPLRAVDKSRSRPSKGSKSDDLKNRSEKTRSARAIRAEISDSMRARIAAATRTVPTKSSSTQRAELTDAELAMKVRKLRAIGQGDGDIRRALASQASGAQLTRVLRSLRA